MKSLTLFVVAVCVTLQSFQAAGSGTGKERAEPMKKYTLDLDKKPEERWLSILSVYNASVPLIIDYFHHQETKIEQSAMNTFLGDMNGYFGEYGLEMKAIADFFGIELGIVVTLNLSYELRRLQGGHPNTTGNATVSPPPHYHGGIGCTSIVANNEHGKVFHGRNLDWEVPNTLRNLTVQVDFMKKGKVVFTGDVIVGIVGVFTGISRKGGFSISINERNLGGQPIKDGIDGLLKKSQCPSHLAREVLTSSESYTDALWLLEKVPVIAPVYYITAGAGPNEGAVLTRNKNSLLNLWMLGNDASNQTEWYLLETNYDNWKSPKPYDNRRAFGNEYMQAAGQKEAASAKGLSSVLSKWPLRNFMTAYTTMMVPRDFYIKSANIYN